MSLCPSCSQSGLRTVFPGNKTHNAVCGLLLPPAERHCPLTALLALGACILALTAAQLSLHLWQLRRQRVWPPGQLCPRWGRWAPC